MINLEVAKADLDGLLEAWGVDLDASMVSEGFQAKYDRVLKTVVGGGAIIDGTSLSYTGTVGSLSGTELKFAMPGMKALKAADGTGDKDSVRKLIRVTAAWTGKTEREMTDLTGPDYLFAQALFTIFFAQ